MQHNKLWLSDLYNIIITKYYNNSFDLFVIAGRTVFRFKSCPEELAYLLLKLR